MIEILNTLAEITLYSAVLFAFILLYKKLFCKHISAVMHYAVWGLLILRLLLPVTVDGGLHFFVMPAPQEAASPVADDADNLLKQYAASAPLSDEPANMPVAANNAAAADNNAQAADNETVPAASGAESAASPPFTIGWPEVLVMLWAAGMLGSFVYMYILRRRLGRSIKSSRKAAEGSVLKLIAACKAELGVRADIRVSVISWLNSPALYSCARPELLLPESMILKGDARQIEFGIRHELTHYNHRDHLVLLLLKCLRCVYWFNPVVWLAFRGIEADMETACDARVTAGMHSADRFDYIQAIIDLGSDIHTEYMLGMGATERRSMEKRVRGIFMQKKSGRFAKLSAFLTACALFVCCFTTACQPVSAAPQFSRDAAVKAVSATGAITSASPQASDENANGTIIKPGNILQSPTTGAGPSATGKVITKAGNPPLSRDRQAIQNQIQKLNGRLQMTFKPNDKVTINVDAVIVPPGNTKYPAVRVRPQNLSKEQFETCSKYLTNGQPLYYETYDALDANSMSKEEISAILPKIQASLKNDNLPENIKSSLSRKAKEMKRDYPGAKSRAEEQLYNGKLTKEKENPFYSTMTELKCYLGKDQAARLSLMQTVNKTFTEFGFSNNNYDSGYTTFERTQGADAPKLKTTYAVAKAKAEDFVHNVMGEDSTMEIDHSSLCYELGTSAGYTKETSPQAYSFWFTRNYGGVAVRPVNTLSPAVYTPAGNKRRVGPETVLIIIDDGGFNMVVWSNHTEFVQNVSPDSTLLGFDKIKDVFTQYCNKKFAWVPGDDTLPKGVSATVNVKRVELNMMTIPENGSIKSYVTVPVWDFIAEMEYDKNVRTPSGTPIEGEKNVSIITVNAVDGSIINRDQGY